MGCGSAQSGDSASEVAVVQGALTLGGGIQFTDSGSELRLTGDQVWVRMTNSGVFEVGRSGRTGFLMQYGGDDSPDTVHFGLMKGTDSDTSKQAFGKLPPTQARGSTATANGGCGYYNFQNLNGTPVSLTWTVCLTGGSDEVAVSVKASGEGPKQSGGYTLETLSFPAAPALRPTGKGYAVVPRMEGYILPVGWISNTDEQAWENYDHREWAAQSRDWNMPFYGVVEDDGRALYVEVKDAADSVLVVRNPQGGAPRASVRFNSSLGVFGSTERRMVYVPMDGASYVTLAKRYRSSAQRNGKLTTLATKMGPVPDVARLIGGALVRSTAMTNNVRTGTVGPVPPGAPFPLSEIQNQVNTLATTADYPINRGVLHLNGWGQRGFDNLHPDVILPASQCNPAPMGLSYPCGPNSAIGGYAALKNLVDSSKAPGTLLVEPHDNYHDLYLDTPTYAAHRDYARIDRNGSTTMVDAWDGGAQTFLCSSKARPLLWRTLDALKANGIVPNAYYIDVLSAAAPDECFNSSFPVTRTQTLGFWSGVLDELSSNRGMVAGSEEPVDWSARYIDHVHWTSHARGTRRTDDVENRPLGMYGFNTPIGVPVPLWSLVYHDAVVTPFPFTSGERFEGAFDAWESGGAPMIELNDSIFAGVRRAAVRQMQLHSTVGKEPLVNHSFVDSGDRFMVAQSQFGTSHTTLVNRTVGAMAGGGLPGTLNTASQTAATYPIRVEAIASIAPVPRSPTPGCADGAGTFHANWVPVSIPARWQSDSDMLAKDQNLVRIAHVERWFDPNGAANGQSEILANGDEQKTTKSWPVGGTVNDTIKFCIDPAIALGDYPLLVGLYDASTAWRSVGRLPLPTTRGDRMVNLGTFTVTDNAFSFTKQIKGEARTVLARPTGGGNVELMTEWLLGPWVPLNEDVLLEIADAGTGSVVASKRYTPATTPSSWQFFSRWREQRQTLGLPLKRAQAIYTVRTGLINSNNVLLGLSSADIVTRKVKLGTLIATDDGSNITQLRFWPNGSCMRRQPHENRAEHWGEIGINPLGGPSNGASWSAAWGNPTVDARHDLLHLTFDDVVRREPFLTGPNGAAENSNVLSFQVTMTGNITFLVQPFNPNTPGATSQTFPALRHSNGHIELGGIRYGMNETFGSFGAFNGQSLPDRNSVRVMLFTRGSSELAMRVDDGRKIYDSNFQTVGDTLQQMQFVGDNAAGDDAGSIDVSPIDGCVGLSSALVDAAYSR